MRRLWSIVVVVVCLSGAITALAQTKSQVGTWKADIAHSDFGSDPAPKSVTATVLQDSPKMLSWHVHMIDDKGKAFDYSWKGPEDGSMHPVMSNGKEIGKQSAKRESDGSLTRHGEDPDGSSFDAHDKISDDGNTINEESTTKTKDNQETKEKAVYHRVKNPKKPADQKPS